MNIYYEVPSVMTKPGSQVISQQLDKHTSSKDRGFQFQFTLQPYYQNDKSFI